jgi:hypothetical protein
MAFNQGAPLPDIKETTTRTTGAPDYYSNYLSGLSQAGQTALKQTADTGIAGMTDLQKQGYGALPAAATAYKPGLTAAEQTAANAAGISAADIQNFMNPYTQNVVNEMARLSQQNVQRNLLPTLKAGFVGTGGLGSQRYAGALGQGLADVQSNLTGQQYGALSSGYKDALQAAINEAQLQNQVAQTQGQLARAEQELGLTGAGALTKAGAEQQAFEQSKLDFPLKQATNVSNLLRNYTIPTSETTTFVGPRAGAYQKSPLEIATGMLSLLGASKQGSLLEKLGASLFKSGSSGDGTTGGNINWDEINRILEEYKASGDASSQTGGTDTGAGSYDTGTDTSTDTKD